MSACSECGTTNPKHHVPYCQGANDLAAPRTLYITDVADDEHLICGGEDGKLLLAVFASRNAAEHFVRYCVEFEKTFAGVRP